MILEEVKRPYGTVGGYKLCKHQKIIMDFASSGMDCAKLRFEDGEKRCKEPASDTLGLNRAAKRLRVDVFARTINGDIYLFKGVDK